MSHRDVEEASLLATKDYDEDAPSVSSGSGTAVMSDAEDGELDVDVDNDKRLPKNEKDDDESGSVDGSSVADRISTDRARLDREVLEQDYEDDDEDLYNDNSGLLGKTRKRLGVFAGGLFSGRLFKRERNGYVAGESMQLGQRRRRRGFRASRSHRERRRRGEQVAEMMYEMEEGGEAAQSTLPSRNSSDLDLHKLESIQKEKRRRHFVKSVVIHLTVIFVFLIFIFAAYRASKASPKISRPIELLSNGTSLFAPTTILISLDGFRADFLQRNLTPTLNSFIREGVSPLFMRPPMPSVTFVSHFVMSTGRYVEENGLVGNTFWDPQLQEEFYYTQTDISMKPKWWNAEPFWVTAEKQQVKTAIHMWPGSEAHVMGVDPTFFDQYNGNELLSNKVKKLFGWLDLPGPSSAKTVTEAARPRLIVTYVPNVDADGHLYGPNSTEIRQTIKNADNMLADIFNGLRERNLTDIVNVVIVSDHGMATTSVDRLVQLDDLVDLSKIEHIDGWPLYGLRPYNLSEVEPLYEQIKERSKQNSNFEVYLRDKNMPPEYHFSKNPRIAPLWIVPKTGWAIVKKDEFDVAKGQRERLVYHPRGVHGYDYRHPLMRAIFVARGPAFPHAPHSRVEPFDNINLYNVVCDSVGMEPLPNNGTIRLPFRPVGLHTDPDAPTLETPDDLPPEGAIPASEIPASEIEDTTHPVPSSPTSPSESAPIPTSSTHQGDGGDGNDGKPKGLKGMLGSWLDWFNDTFEDVRDRISKLLGANRKGDDDD